MGMGRLAFRRNNIHVTERKTNIQASVNQPIDISHYFQSFRLFAYESTVGVSPLRL
jgi:hypothetical protein